MTASLASLISAKALGAFYTPQSLADILVQWVVQSGEERLLEPSAGEGALVKAALNCASSKRESDVRIRILACDIDHQATEKLRTWLDVDHEVRTIDFLELRPEDVQPVHGVLANPPFTRNHSLAESRRNELRKRFKITGAAGLWVPFLLHACSFLAPDGRLAAVLPASSIFSRYGQQAIARICKQFRVVEIRQIADRPLWTNGADERGAILLAAGYGTGSSSVPRPSRWTAAGNLLEDCLDLHSAAFQDGRCAASRLATLAQISIGAVTGNNRVFLLNDEDRRKFEIDELDLKCIVTRARQIPGLRVSKSELYWAAQRGEKTWLLAPRHIRDPHVGVRRRLATITDVQKTGTVWFKKRDPWWNVDIGKSCDAVFTYMNHNGPRIVLCSPEIYCTNTLHRLVFNTDIQDSVKVATALSMIGTFGQLAAKITGRTYGGGVLKFELAEARALPIFSIPIDFSNSASEQVEAVLRVGNLEMARQISDSIVLPGIYGRSWRSAAAEMNKLLCQLRSARHGRLHDPVPTLSNYNADNFVRIAEMEIEQ